MRRSYVCLQRNVFHNSKSQRHILPSPNFVSLASAAISGIISHVTDSTARDAYVKYVKEGIIRDEVLAEASFGSMRTMALFHNLQNPLWEKHKFDMKELVEYVPRALEIYTDTLGRLVMQTTAATTASEEHKEKETKKDATEESVEETQRDPLRLLFERKDTVWKKQAQENPESLAGRLARMTTERMFDEHYLGAELFMWVNTTEQMPSVKYVAGSSVVKQSALLSAQIDYVLDETNEFAASDETSPVAARVDVLYEIDQSYTPMGTEKGSSASHSSISQSDESDELESTETTTTSTSLSNDKQSSKAKVEKDDTIQEQSNPHTSQLDNPGPTSAAETVDSPKTVEDISVRSSTESATAPPAAAASESTETTSATEIPDPTDSDTGATTPDDKTIVETNLVVASLEGWMHGGPDGNELRWKISQVRNAFEFQ